MTAEDLAARPISGEAWNRLFAAAEMVDQVAAQGGHDSVHDVYIMAAALVAVRLNDDGRRQIVADNIAEAITNHIEEDGNSLSLTRSLPGYIIAADLIDLKTFAPSIDSTFRAWLEFVVYELKLDDATQVEKHEIRGNNHGTQAGVARIAAARYLDKQDDLERAAAVFKGWLGDSSSYNGFSWGNLCWQVDPNNPVGILPKGSTMMVAGALRDVDGVQPDDQRRAGCPQNQNRWPPRTDTHVWGGLQGAVGQAYLLARAGYDAWEWGDQAILRAISWQHDPARGNAPAESDDFWILPLVDSVYSTSYWIGTPVGYGKQVGWTDWTHGGVVASPLAVNVNIVGAGAVDIQPPGISYVEGTLVQLTAIPDPDWMFVGWKGDIVSTDNPLSFNITGFRNLTAVFSQSVNTVAVQPIASTNGAPSGEAEDVALWIHPTDPARSLVIGTYRTGWVLVWSMQGVEVQRVNQNTSVKYVDVRYGVALGADTVDVVAANLRDNGRVSVFKVNPNYTVGDALVQLADRNSANNQVQRNSWAFSLYKRPSDGALFLFETPKNNVRIRQYRIQGDGLGGITVTPERDLNYFGDTADGMVVDEAFGYLYVSEANEGFYKFHTEAELGSDPIAFIQTFDALTPENEGMAIYQCNDGEGYILLASKGSSSIKIFDRNDENRLLKNVIPLSDNGAGIQSVGIDVTAFVTLPAYPRGVLAAHDREGRRFHLYDWGAIAEGTLTTCVNGEAPLSPQIAVSPHFFDFGDVYLSANAFKQFLVTNEGEAPLTISNLSLDDLHASDFKIESTTGNLTLSTTESLRVDVSFNPSSLGSKFAILKLENNDPLVDTLEIQLTGKGIDFPDSVEEDGALPKEIVLRPSYPNPFNAETTIAYALPRPTRVRLAIYNLRGQQIRMLVDADEAPGFKKTQWDGRDGSGRLLASGTYYIQLVADQHRLVRKLLLLK
jgi:myo-inositol-hexaphosphate 3-phosphohydrolase